MNTVHLITMKLDGRSFFSAVCPLDQGKAQNIAGSIMDMLADSTGLAFDYEVVAIPYIDPITPISHVHDTAAEAFVKAKIPVKNTPAARHVITPENSSVHLTARGAHLLNAHLLAALKAFRNAKSSDELDSAEELAVSAIDASEGFGSRAQSFAERERDLLEANNRYLEEARAARSELASLREQMGQPAGYMRRFAYDGIDVMKMKKSERPPGWQFHDLTRGKICDDDVALFADPKAGSPR